MARQVVETPRKAGLPALRGQLQRASPLSEIEPQQREAQHTTERAAHEDLSMLAYVLWEERGCPEGSPDEDWYQSERDLARRTDIGPS